MRKYVNLAASGMLMLSCMQCFGADKKEHVALSPVHRFHAGTDIALTRHSVDADSDTKSTGMMYGIKVGYEYALPSSYYASVDVAYSPWRNSMKVSATEDGWLWDCDYKATFKSKFAFVRSEAKFGREFGYSDSVKILPFLMFGHARINNTNVYCETIPYAYDQQFKSISDYVSYGIGAKISYQMLPSFNVALGLKGNHCFWGQHKVTFMEDVTTESFKDKFGYEVSLPLSWKVGSDSQMHFTADPYMLKLDASDALEIYGLRLAMDFSY